MSKDLIDQLADIGEAEQPFPDVGNFHLKNAIAFYGNKVYETNEKAKQAKSKDEKKKLLGQIKEWRSVAKACGLALAYGGGPSILLRGVPGCTQTQAQEMWDNYFSVLGTFKKHLKNQMIKAKENLYVKTFLGRWLWVTILDDPKLAWKGKNNVYNSPIQGSGADTIKLILIKIGEWVEKMNLYKWQNNNITRNYIARVVSTSKVTPQLERALDRLPDGNTLIIVLDKDGNVLQQYDRTVQMDMSIIVKHNLKVEV